MLVARAGGERGGFRWACVVGCGVLVSGVMAGG